MTIPAELKIGYYWVETSAGIEIGLWDGTSWRFCAGEPREQFDHIGILVWSENLMPPAAAIEAVAITVSPFESP